MAPAHGNGRRTVLRWSAGIVALVVAGFVGAVIANALNEPATGTACDVPSIAQESLPSVVTILANDSTGSGEILDTDGYILTNNHVIASAASRGSLEVVFDDGTKVPATITGRDPLTDLAVIKVNDRSGLRPIPKGDSSTLQVGQPVVVLGAPLGLSSTVTSGIVSALDRTVQVPGEGARSALLIDAIQTDAAVNPGNSGGALVNCSGQLVGIPTAGATVPTPTGQPSAGGSIGLNFAIPVNLATKVADEIISTGTVRHAYFGIQARPVSANATRQNGTAEGLLVTGVVTGSPAADAGLRSGDVITSIEGQAAVSTDQLVALTLTRRAGDRVEIGYERDGRSSTTTVTLGNVP